MEQNRPKGIDATEHLGSAQSSASEDESRREHYESEIRKALDDVKREAAYAALVSDYAALEAENARLAEERDNAIYARDGFMAALEKMAAERDDMDARLGIIERNTQDATARSLAQNTLAKRNGAQG